MPARPSVYADRKDMASLTRNTQNKVDVDYHCGATAGAYVQ